MVQIVEEVHGKLDNRGFPFHFYQLRFVVGRDCAAEEQADGVVAREDLGVFGREGVEEEGGEGGGGYVLGSEAEDVSDLFARIELGVLGKETRGFFLKIGSSKGKWVPMDHSKSKKHEGVAV